MDYAALAALAAKLPDLPRWVALRGLLLSGRGAPIGRVSFEPLSLVVLRNDGGLAAIAGRPDVEDIRAAAARAEEIVVADADVAWVRSALGDSSAEKAALYLMPRDRSLEMTPSVGGILTAALLLTPASLPDALRQEIDAALSRGELVGAAFDGTTPVSFCLADSVTESLWDVSVETLPSHRRRGFATQASRFMIAQHARAGRRPVWGATASDPGSAGLAATLGFVESDTIWVVSTRPRAVTVPPA